MTHEGKLRMDLHAAIRRVMAASGWQVCYEPAVAYVKRGYLTRTFGVESSTALGDEELRLAIAAWKSGAVKLAPCTRQEYSLPTPAVIRKIVAIGKYSLGKIYGDDWFWRHLPDWTEAAYRNINRPDVQPRRAHALNVLTQWEAHHVIRVLETIEAKIKCYGAKNISPST